MKKTLWVWFLLPPCLWVCQTESGSSFIGEISCRCTMFGFFCFFSLAFLVPSLCSSHLANIYPHLTQTDLFLNFICLTRYFPAPRNEERGWVCLLNLPTYPSDSVGISLYFLGWIHFSYQSRPAPSISYSRTFLPLRLSITSVCLSLSSWVSIHLFKAHFQLAKWKTCRQFKSGNTESQIKMSPKKKVLASGRKRKR